MLFRSPFKLKAPEERERLGTVLHVLAQAVSDLNRILSPFLPHAANRVHQVLGGQGEFMPMPRSERVQDLDDAERDYLVITGDYDRTPAWASVPVQPGTVIAKPAPVFTKLDDEVVHAERARLGLPTA